LSRGVLRQRGHMGIRYYAYAFDADQTEAALAEPGRFLSGDPLADAWGLEPGRAVSVNVTFTQRPPKREMLYLDKAWTHLQLITSVGAEQSVPRPAFQLFEGQVTMHDLGWDPWIRAVTPEEVTLADQDLATITDQEAESRVRQWYRGFRDADDEVRYALDFLERARLFVHGLAEDGRGMAYMIG